MSAVPMLLLDYGRESRPVTQEDVDRWLKVEESYDMLLQMILDIIPDQRLLVYLRELQQG